MKILITGATGYLGAIITIHLHSAGYETIAWCRNLNESKQQEINKFTNQIIIGDILDDNALQAAKKANPDVIIHLVSLNHKDSELNIEKANQINVMATWKLLDAFKTSTLSKFIYFSTIQVLGTLKNEVIDEKYTPNPQNIYGLTHLLSEQLLDFYRNKAGFHPLVLRLANGYGSPAFHDNNCWWLVVNDLCKMAYQEKKITLQSDGSPQRDFIHVTDIKRAVSVLIERPNHELANTYHLASSQTYTILELALFIKQKYQQRFNMILPIFTAQGEYDINPQKTTNPDKYKLNISLLEQLGFKPTISLQQGIHELFTYLKNNN